MSQSLPVALGFSRPDSDSAPIPQNAVCSLEPLLCRERPLKQLGACRMQAISPLMWESWNSRRFLPGKLPAAESSFRRWVGKGV